MQDGKISVGRFLITMANMDNKIVFDEQEYPAIDLDELEFECSDDLDKMREYLKQPVDNDSDPLVYSESTKSNENITTTSKTLKSTKTKSKSDMPPVLTRSKARKLATKSQQLGEEHQKQIAVIPHATKRYSDLSNKRFLIILK